MRQTPAESELPPTVLLSMTEDHAKPTKTAINSLIDFEVDSPEFDKQQKVGRYRLLHELGSGGMGVVVLAYDELLQREVAIKLVRRKFLNQPATYRRFVNEALLTSRLQHPCIVPIYDLGQADDHRPYFAMKLISGQLLSKILANTSGLQQDRMQLLKIFERVCQSIAYSHAQNIVHLDIKPSNIMIGQFGEVHVMDWGLAREFGLQKDAPPPNSERLNPHAAQPAELNNGEEHEVGGTPAYMSPEQARGDAVGPSADVFGLGALLCEILTSKPPYDGADHKRTHARAMRGKVEDAYRRLDTCNRDIRLTTLAKQCLSPCPTKRPQSAEVVASAITTYLASALEQAESDVCRFFDLTLDLFCIATMDGYFSRINVNFPKVLGYSEQKLISQPFLDFVHPEDVQGTVEVMGDLLQGKPVVQFCNRYRHADGHYVLLEWTAQAIPNEGNIFAVARDVSNRLRLPGHSLHPGK